jgi:hypothetical protein
MTDQEINIAIAEACGVSLECKECGGFGEIGHGAERRDCPCNYGDNLFWVEDYVGDLNAMHEAMRKCIARIGDNVLWADYGRALYIAVWNVDPVPDKVVCHLQNYLAFDLINATARQRAEAFLRTIGKWKE